jgi:hypothetical protein
MKTRSAPAVHILASLVGAGYFGPGVGCQVEPDDGGARPVQTTSPDAVPVRQWQVHDTWAARDLPVLDATIDLLEQSFMVTVTDIAARTKLTPSVVAAALEALDPVYVDFRKTTTGGDPRYWYVFKVTPEARRAVGQWPTAESLASRLAEELAAGARDEPDAQRQGLLAYAARLVGETLRDATVRAAGRVLAPAFGGLPVPERGMPVPEPEPLSENEFPSLVDLPELPELLRTRGARTSPAPESDEPSGEQPAVAEAQQLEPLPEPDESLEPEEILEPGEPSGEQQPVPEAQLLEPLPEPDEFLEPDGFLEPGEPSGEQRGEPSGEQPAVPEAQQLEPLPEPAGSDATDGVDAPPGASALSAEPDEVRAQ